MKDVDYGSSKTSATYETALNPADLAAGAIGIYGIHRAGSTNLNKLVLITIATAEAAGIIADSDFVGDEIFIAVGKTVGCEVSQPIKLSPSGLKSAAGAKYVAPVRGVAIVGYNSASSGSSLNTPTLVKGDDFTIGVINKADKVSGFRQPFQKVQLSVQARIDAETDYSLLSRWIAMVNLRTDEVFIDKALIKIVSNGTGSVAANSATLAAVNGAVSLTASANHGIGVGDYVILGSPTGAAGDLYQAVTGTATTTLVLDRPFQGATATIANANFIDAGATVPTELGLKFTDRKDLLNLKFVVQGVAAEGATVSVVTAPTIGSGGSNEQVVALEKEALGKKGSEDRITSYMPLDQVYSEVAGSDYDLYFLEIQNSNQAGGDQGAVFNLKSFITCAFVAGVANTGTFNQSDFEDIMTQLFTTFPAISA